MPNAYSSRVAQHSGNRRTRFYYFVVTCECGADHRYRAGTTYHRPLALMSSAALVLVEHAQFLRTSAARWRRLADETSSPDLAEQLIRLAAELEHRAHELEARAGSISKTVAKTRQLSAEIQRLAEEAGQRAKRLRRKPGSDPR